MRCTSSLTFNNCTLCPHCIYVFCIYQRTNSDLCHLQHKLIGFITEMKSVYFAVRTGSLNKAVCASYLKGLKNRYYVQHKDKKSLKCETFNHNIQIQTL